jgi:hypothetical protein
MDFAFFRFIAVSIFIGTNVDAFAFGYFQDAAVPELFGFPA